jgi:hypothetical protein
VSKLEEVYEDLRPTLMKLMDKGLIGGVLAVFSIHAEEVGQEILDRIGVAPLDGVVLVEESK